MFYQTLISPQNPVVNMSACATTLIVLATILGPVTLVFMSVSFGTDHWLEFRVDRDKLTDQERNESKNDQVKARYYHTRDRGIFRECYPGSDTECEYMAERAKTAGHRIRDVRGVEKSQICPIWGQSDSIREQP